MSLLDNLKGTLRAMIGQKTDKVVEEAQAKVEVEAPKIVEEAAEAQTDAEVASEVDQAMDKVADEVTTENNQ